MSDTVSLCTSFLSFLTIGFTLFLFYKYFKKNQKLPGDLTDTLKLGIQRTAGVLACPENTINKDGVCGLACSSFDAQGNCVANITCPTGTVSGAGGCVFDVTCPRRTVKSSNGNCKKMDDIDLLLQKTSGIAWGCPDGQSKIAGQPSDACFPLCDAGWIPTGTKCTPTCPTGTVESTTDKSICLFTNPSCPEKWVLSGDKKACVATAAMCTTGWLLSDDKKSCVKKNVSCPAGWKKKDGTATCVLDSSSAVKTAATICPKAGMLLENGYCFAEACPKEYPYAVGSYCYKMNLNKLNSSTF